MNATFYIGAIVNVPFTIVRQETDDNGQPIIGNWIARSVGGIEIVVEEGRPISALRTDAVDPTHQLYQTACRLLGEEP